MRIPYITTEDLYSFKADLKDHQQLDGFTNSWIIRKFGPDFFRHMKQDMPEIKLSMDAPKPEETDYENVKRIYNGLHLNESNAADERIWAGLSMSTYYDYVVYRWPSVLKDKKTGEINTPSFLEKYTVATHSKRTLMRNAIARLWWIGHLTYDKSREDPYELTKLVCRNQNFIVNILDRSFANNEPLLKTFLQAMIDAEKEGFYMGKKETAELTKYVNRLGGIYILDTLPEDAFYKMLMDFIRKNFKGSNAEEE